MKTIELNTVIEVRDIDELSSADRTLVEKAIKACDNAYAPYSNFHVGACIRLKNGLEIIGANQENAASPCGLCAERTAIFAAQAQYPDQPILSLAIAARNVSGELTSVPTAPCGQCRQVILEIEDRYKQPIRLLLYSTQGTYILNSIQDILPLCFVGNSLGA